MTTKTAFECSAEKAAVLTLRAQIAPTWTWTYLSYETTWTYLSYETTYATEAEAL